MYCADVDVDVDAGVSVAARFVRVGIKIGGVVCGKAKRTTHTHTGTHNYKNTQAKLTASQCD